MNLVFLESPYAGDVVAHVHYARAAMADCIKRHEAPFASHLLYTQPGILNDHNPTERRLGIAAGLMWAAVAAETVVYDDLGVTPGMEQGIMDAVAAGRPVTFRSLAAYADERVENRRARVESLRVDRQMAEMSDDRAYTNGVIAAIDLKLHTARAELDAAMKAAREAKPGGTVIGAA